MSTHTVLQIAISAELASALEERARSCGLTSTELLHKVVGTLATPVMRTRQRHQRAARDYLAALPSEVPEDPLEREAQELDAIRRLAGLVKSASPQKQR